jgi:RNA polymerase sigma-70 factor (ECF subfamily)
MGDAQAGKPLTGLLKAWGDGDAAARERLLPEVYSELRRRAGAYLRRERPDHTLQPTALVNEVYLRLIDQRDVRWQNRAHFFGIASQLMRRILVDHARSQGADKRGGREVRVALEEDVAQQDGPDIDLIALDSALSKLEALDPRQARVVELRYFGGLSVEETAEALGSSPATVKRDWTLARAFLHQQLQR